MNYVPYRVCIARAVYSPEFTPTRSEKIVSATSLNVKDHVSAGVGIEFKILPAYPLPVLTSLSAYGRAALSGMTLMYRFT